MFKKLFGICFFSIGYLIGGRDGVGNTIFSMFRITNDLTQPISISGQRCDPGQVIDVGVNHRGDPGTFMIILGNTGTGPTVHYRTDLHAEGLTMQDIGAIAQFNVSSVQALRDDHVVYDNHQLIAFPVNPITGQPPRNPTFDYYFRWLAQNSFTMRFRGPAPIAGGGAPANNQGTNQRSTAGGQVLAGGALGAPQNGIPAGNQPHAPIAAPNSGMPTAAVIVREEVSYGTAFFVGTGCLFTGILLGMLLRKKSAQNSVTA